MSEPKRKTTMRRRVRKPSATLLREVNTSLKGSGFVFLGWAPNSVGSQGDDRVYGPVVCVSPPPDWSNETAAAASTKLINEVRGITRMLVDITPVSAKKKKRR